MDRANGKYAFLRFCSTSLFCIANFLRNIILAYFKEENQKKGRESTIRKS